MAFENGLLPTPLTPEDAESDAGLELLQPLFDAYRHHFPKMESPYAASDQTTEPCLASSGLMKAPPGCGKT